jgi:hypothetical protein
MAATYDVGTKAWQPDVTEGWVASEVEQKKVDGEKVTLIFHLANGETKSIETTLAAIAEAKDPKLPPLMNPTMLEASDDLTNLSHLNEPAGKHQETSFPPALCPALTRIPHSLASHQATICTKGNLHILGHCPHCDQPLCPCRLTLRTGHGADLRRQAAPNTGPAFVCYSRGGFCVC